MDLTTLIIGLLLMVAYLLIVLDFSKSGAREGVPFEKLQAIFLIRPASAGFTTLRFCPTGFT
jgi:hypothetical protein